MSEQLKNRIGAARGEIQPDVVVKGGKVVNVFSREIIEADVAIYDGIVVGVGNYDGPKIIDARGMFVCPGFIDGHFHVESTMLSPPELTKAVLPYGTTAIVADPHEIANVMGERGIQYIIESSEGLPVDMYIVLPSCVPATTLESSGALLTCEDLKRFRGRHRVLGLAEMMNYPGVLARVNDVIEKIDFFAGGVMDGHSPLLSGRDLNAYITAGLCSDHECTELEEAREKLRLGMHIMIREGTQAKNMKSLLSLVTPGTVSQCSLVSDDLHPHDLLKKGHLNHLIDIAVSEGMDPISAIHMVTHSPARYFGLKHSGAIAPGFHADILILSSLHPVEVKTVLKRGIRVFDKGFLTCEIPKPAWTDTMSSMNIKPYTPYSFAIEKEGDYIRTIGLIPDQILTKNVVMKAPVRGGEVVADKERDLIKIIVVERHRGTGNIGKGVVQGFGLKEGALASSVAHDSHNIIAVGCTDSDLFVAVKEVEKMGGGLVVVNEGRTLARLPLPVAGLISNLSLEEVAHAWEDMSRAAGMLGCRLKEPFMALSFLALPVIPELKITDRGLVDVGQFTHVSLFVS